MFALVASAVVSVDTERPTDTQHSRRRFRHARPYSDRAAEEAAFYNLTLQSNDGTIPEGALLHAKAQRDQLQATPGTVRPGAGLSWASWTPLGPGNVGGRVHGILVDPSEPTTMLLGSAGGGIWRTTNGGARWSPVDDFMASLAVRTMVASPADFHVQYAGTGEGFYNGIDTRGAGIFKSIDGGTTWFHLASTSGPEFQYVNRLAISPDSTTLLAATRWGLYRSTDGGSTFTPIIVGVFLDFRDVEFHPSDSSKAVAVRSGEAYYSTDGGQTFDPASGISVLMERTEAAYAPGAPNVVYVVGNRSDGSIYRSADGGVSYTLVPDATHPAWLPSSGSHGGAVFVDPTNPDVLIVGGVDLYRSTDGGATLTQISRSDLSPASAHSGQHVIVPMPGFNGTSVKGAFFGNDGGIYTTADIYTVGDDQPSLINGWQALNNSLAITQFNGAAAHEASGKIVGGTQDTGTITFVPEGGTNGWVREFPGDGGFAAIDQTDPNYCYGETAYLTLHRSANGCGEGTGSYIYQGIGDATPLRANFIAPFILDPNDQRRLLAGGTKLWRTNDAQAATPSWSSIKPPADVGSNISAIAVTPGNSDQIWVGHNSGEVYRTTNGTSVSPSWTRVGDSVLPARFVSRIAIDRNDDRIIYVTFGGFEADNIWKTVDGGATWNDIHGLLPAAPIRSIAINPGNSNWLYVGTETGIFVSEDGGLSWIIPHDGPANVPVEEVFFSGSTLYIATRGRGMYQASVGDFLPGKVKQIAPTGYSGDTTPLYRWQADLYATWYLLWVDDTTGNRIVRWYAAEAAGCAGGGICEAAPDTVLTAGAAKWWVRSWNAAGDGPWSSGLPFDTGFPSAEVLATYPVPEVQPGYSSALWLLVRNTGTFPLSSGSQAYYWVTGPGQSGYVGVVDVSGLAGGTSAWYLLQWDVPVGSAGGTHTYWGRIWNAQFGGWISPWSAGQSFAVLPTPASGARVLSTYQVDGAMQGGTARLWALVRNIGTTTSSGRVWFHVYGVGWILSTEVAALASGASGWYYSDWAIPSAQPVGANWYVAQLWNSAGTVALSPASAWQPFTIGFNAQFTSGVEGFTAVTGSWSHNSGSFLYTPGEAGEFVTAAYSAASFSNFDMSVRLWQDGDADSLQGVLIRGTPVSSFLVDLWESGYAFTFARNQTYVITKAGTNSNRIVLDSGISSAIAPGSAWNVIRVVANGRQLSFYINGTLIWAGEDDDFTEGKVGIAAYRQLTESGFGFWVDYVTLTGAAD